MLHIINPQNNRNRTFADWSDYRYDDPEPNNIIYVNILSFTDQIQYLVYDSVFDHVVLEDGKISLSRIYA